MADTSDTSQVLPTAPPPPQEVKVRTLKSDLASMASSGGGPARYQNVKIAEAEAAKSGNPKGLMMIVAIVILLVVIGAIGFYFVTQLVLKK